jgi:hypothetical protein
LLARTPTIADAGAFCNAEASGNPVKLGTTECSMVATALHYLFTVHFGFLFLEALNNYCVNTYVVNGVPLYGRVKNLLLGMGIPLVPVAATAITHFNTYISDSTCWCNVNEVNLIGEIVPVLMLCVPALILNEAAGMGSFKTHSKSVKDKRYSAYTSSRGAMVVIPLSFSAWLLGMTAVSETNLSLYSLSSTLNLILGIVIIIAHTLGNDRARQLLFNLFCCCNCKKKKRNPTKNPTRVKNIKDEKSDNGTNNTGNESNQVKNQNSPEEEIDIDNMIRDSISQI